MQGETRQTLQRLQRRRELEADLEKANEEALEAADAAENAEKALAIEKKDLERLQDSWMAGQAAALAMSLKPGGMPLPCVRIPRTSEAGLCCDGRPRRRRKLHKMQRLFCLRSD